MKQKDKENLLAETCRLLETLRQTPCLATYEIMRYMLEKTDARLEDIGTDQTEINRLLHKEELPFVATCANDDERCKKRFMQDLSFDALIEFYRPLNLIRPDIRPDEMSMTSYAELEHRLSGNFLRGIRKQIRDYCHDNDQCGLCKLKITLKVTREINAFPYVTDDIFLELQAQIVLEAFEIVNGASVPGDCSRPDIYLH